MITVRDLRKTYASKGKGNEPVVAVDGVSFDVAPGEIVGFLGPNGAGKTTTLRMLATLLNPTSGSATVADCDLLADPSGVRRRIGYVAQGGGTDGMSTVREELMIQARLYGMDKTQAAASATEWMQRLDLGGLDARRTKTLSGGQRRRLDIALGMVHSPVLIFLDEPTTGLDPQSRANMWEHVRRLREETGTTIFLTTHYLDEADALSDRLLVIDRGNIVATGTPDELKTSIQGDILTVVVSEPERAAELLRAHEAVIDSEVDGTTVRSHVRDGEKSALGLLNLITDSGITVESFAVARPSLDDVFLTLTGRSLREQAA